MVINKNNKLKKIINIYQLNYKNDRSPGLGDFIRGCFCLMQISKLLNVDFDIDISNHPMSKYIETNKCNNKIDYNDIDFYIDLNRNESKDDKKKFIHRLNKYLNNKNTDTVTLLSTAFPIFNYHTDEGRNFIKSRLIPNNMMNNYIDNTLNDLGLQKYDYSVIHIRTGDKYLVENEEMSVEFINKINEEINKIKQKDKKYLLISDNNELKKYYINTPNFYVYIKNIEHLGGEFIKSVDNDGVMNTMLDFYLMSYSNSNISISVYSWKSGFSEWCSKVYNIPFSYVIL